MPHDWKASNTGRWKGLEVPKQKVSSYIMLFSPNQVQNRVHNPVHSPLHSPVQISESRFCTYPVYKHPYKNRHKKAPIIQTKMNLLIWLSNMSVNLTSAYLQFYASNNMTKFRQDLLIEHILELTQNSQRFTSLKHFKLVGWGWQCSIFATVAVVLEKLQIWDKNQQIKRTSKIS